MPIALPLWLLLMLRSLAALLRPSTWPSLLLLLLLLLLAADSFIFI